jgi:hypothetical protein
MGIWPINDVFGLSAVKKNYNIFFIIFLTTDLILLSFMKKLI